ncbi:MAG: YhdH/YhfP family quinone oxidoreductase [Planctomycetota bacterium]|nr:YhdH/YhfP family quinone oxidoreductase [Planctomycetota bacterium]
MMFTKSKCMWVSQDESDAISCQVSEYEWPELPEGYVRIRVHYSSLNYKDALAASGHPGVVRQLPIIPGIDAAGEVLDGGTSGLDEGQVVMVAHAEFGTQSHGGYSEIVQVPAEWVSPLPQNLTPREAMAIGTAGFTAAQCVEELQRHSIEPDQGPVVVTGATGGVGVFAVKLLAKLGFEVHAVTGKADKADWLKSNGAAEILARADVDDTSDRPLLSSRWAGAVDTVGGNLLATVLRGAKPFSCVTACGLVAGHELNLTVYPFILRGVTLQGVDTANIPIKRRRAIWQRIATDWSFDNLDALINEVELDGLSAAVDSILQGQVAGRVVVKL